MQPEPSYTRLRMRFPSRRPADATGILYGAAHASGGSLGDPLFRIGIVGQLASSALGTDGLEAGVNFRCRGRGRP